MASKSVENVQALVHQSLHKARAKAGLSNADITVTFKPYVKGTATAETIFKKGSLTHHIEIDQTELQKGKWTAQAIDGLIGHEIAHIHIHRNARHFLEAAYQKQRECSADQMMEDWFGTQTALVFLDALKKSNPPKQQRTNAIKANHHGKNSPGDFNPDCSLKQHVGQDDSSPAIATLREALADIRIDDVHADEPTSSFLPRSSPLPKSLG
jgi:predicted SprT family Zn-dependent metalloprotease